MPFTAREKSAWLFSTAICMMTVFAAVICGVTFSVSAASRNDTVTVLFDTVWMGICTPCVISAAMLFCVVTRGVDSRRPLPLVSSAERATSRLKAPLTDPSARFTALGGPFTPRFTAAGWQRLAPAVEPDRLHESGNAHGSRFRAAGLTTPLKPHWTHSARA